MKFVVAAMMALVSFNSYSDSACWPEQELANTAAIGWVYPINESFYDSSLDEKRVEMAKYGNRGKICQVRAFQSSADTNPTTLACSQIFCIKGDCGSVDENPFTHLPVINADKNFVQVSTKGGGTVWLKFLKPPEIVPPLTAGTVGTLYPVDTNLYNLPVKNTFSFKSTNGVGLKAVAINHVNGEEWVKANVFELNGDDVVPVLAKKIGTGYFLYRDKNKKIASILSALYCD